ncbi:YybH family protein [Arenibaculum sp.]|jgi:ketosteroid isomerase-like protein|uniref:YybH family protein n=1 Tax=Arenibaculum sp. TaxID=2865862 RepID=UPI002E11EF4F|nr:nuclear transport factor 2 family protein [Arenibaculum sp.]
MTTERDERAIHALIEDWTDAICKGDIDGVLANRADDIVMYDVPEPIQEKGIDAYRRTWTLFFEHNEAGPDRFRLSDVQVVAGGDVAYAHGLLTIGGGDAYCRLTLGLRRIGGMWKVAHEHHSIPIKLGR